MIKKTIIAILLSFAALSVAQAQPQGDWPEEAHGLVLPQAEWILVVPARRLPDGSVSVWDKEDEWTRQWVVPRATPSGVRTVAIVGDSEDRRMVGGWSLDGMDAGVLGQLASKYKAPAIAVAIADGYGDVAVAGWMPGEGASWLVAGWGGGRDGSLGVMDDIFAGVGSGFDVAITGQRMNGGSMEYRIEISHPIIDEVIHGISGLEITGYEGMESPSVIVRVTDGRDIETVLRSAGLTLKQ